MTLFSCDSARNRVNLRRERTRQSSERRQQRSSRGAGDDQRTEVSDRWRYQFAFSMRQNDIYRVYDDVEDYQSPNYYSEVSQKSNASTDADETSYEGLGRRPYEDIAFYEHSDEAYDELRTVEDDRVYVNQVSVTQH